jgi:hypothetical protein
LEIPTQNVQPPSTTPVPANDKNNPLQSKMWLPTNLSQL